MTEFPRLGLERAKLGSHCTDGSNVYALFLRPFAFISLQELFVFVACGYSNERFKCKTSKVHY